MATLRILAIVLCVLLLSAFKYRLSTESPREAATFTIVDEIPEWQKTEKRLESASTRNCLWGAHRVGDGKLPIDRVSYLRNQLAKRANFILTGKSIVVTNFTIHSNSGYYSRKSGQGGLIPNLINKEPENCSSDNLYGSYAKDEVNPEEHPVALVVVLDISVDDRTTHHRKAVPRDEAALEAVLNDLADEIVRSVGARPIDHPEV